MLKGKTVLLGVTASIAAYKTCNLARMLTKLGADVYVAMTHLTSFIRSHLKRLLSTSALLTRLTEILNTVFNTFQLQKRQML